MDWSRELNTNNLTRKQGTPGQDICCWRELIGRHYEQGLTRWVMGQNKDLDLLEYGRLGVKGGFWSNLHPVAPPPPPHKNKTKKTTNNKNKKQTHDLSSGKTYSMSLTRRGSCLYCYFPRILEKLSWFIGFLIWTPPGWRWYLSSGNKPTLPQVGILYIISPNWGSAVYIPWSVRFSRSSIFRALFSQKKPPAVKHLV